MEPMIDALLKDSPVILDGAWGTQLQARGLPIGACPDAWNLTNHEQVEAVARAYVEAGSQVILTNTFGANRFCLERNELVGDLAEINHRGVEISRLAASGRAKVFASIGPTGKMLASGETTESELKAVFEEQAEALAEAGPDGIVIETMSDLTEAAIAVRAVRATGLPVAVCMVYGVGKQGDRTLMGVTPEKAVAALEEAGADIIGSNCGVGAEAMVAICCRLRAATKRPLWIKPNAGLPELKDGAAVYQTSADQFVAAAVLLREAGADFLGGCCGTSPEFIEALVTKFKG